MRICCLLAILAACSKGQTAPAKKGDACSQAQGCPSPLVCTDAPAGLAATPGKFACAAPARHYTFKAISGVSMGALGASRLVVQHPEKFDAEGSMGGPMDATLLAATLEHSFLGGFCPAAALEAAAALDAQDGGNRLDRPDGIAGCTQSDPTPLTHYSHTQRYNHWAFTTNGGTFERNAHLDIFRDLTLALGDPLSNNPESPALVAPLTAATLATATCSNPVIVPHVYDPQYSPHGEHPGITFCDGQPPVEVCNDGTYVDWCAAAALAGHAIATTADADGFCAAHGANPHAPDRNSPTEGDTYYAHEGENTGCWAGGLLVPFALAIDLNGNGRRDYHEPILLQLHEPFSDVGTDGCDDAHEDGKGGCTDTAHSPFANGVKDPNGDNYDAVNNPNGTEGDLRWEEGEPFQDVGLDGVANTNDFGEGDGKFTVSGGLAHWQAGDLRAAIPSLKNVDFYFDGGIRDVFDLGAMAEAVSGAVRTTRADAFAAYLDFPSIPPINEGSWPASGFDPLYLDPARLLANMLVPYGNPNATPAEIRAGDGDHVGTVNTAYDRFTVFFRWLSERWAPALGAVPKVSGFGREDEHSINFTSLGGAAQDFVVSLPPGYDDPANANTRYPVLIMMHGYGQNAEDMSSTSAATDVLTQIGKMYPTIVIYPSGRCCLTGPHGERTCDESKVDWASQGYVRECQRGSFYLDRQGNGNGDNTAYGQAVFELMDFVDANYRTLPATDGPAF